jgi:hypothetical protein
MVNGNPCSVIDSDTVRGIAFLVNKTPGERADGFHDARLITAGPKLFEALEKIAAQGGKLVEPWTVEVAITSSTVSLAQLSSE